MDITLHSSSVAYRPVFEAMAEMLTEVGIRTTPRMWDPGPAWNKFLQAEGKATQGMYGTWGNYSVFDADAVLHPLYHNEPGGWIGKWYARVEGLDKLIDEARSTVDQPKRKRTLLADPADDPRGGAEHLPVDAVRHPRHLEEGAVRGRGRRVALALRRQAGRPGSPEGARVA